MSAFFSFSYRNHKKLHPQPLSVACQLGSDSFAQRVQPLLLFTEQCRHWQSVCVCIDSKENKTHYGNTTTKKKIIKCAYNEEANTDRYSIEFHSSQRQASYVCLFSLTVTYNRSEAKGPVKDFTRVLTYLSRGQYHVRRALARCTYAIQCEQNG